MEETFFLNELRNSILSKSGIRTITPSDCKTISIEISKSVNKNVSETTIKRLFGFAAVKHKFSKFTITALLEYVDQKDLNNFLPVQTQLNHGMLSDWEKFLQKTRSITESTLNRIRNRSGLPYHMTIGRKFAEHDFDDFYQSEYTFTCFISQPGYGRTILLSHLVEKLTSTNDMPYKNSAFLFVSANSLFQDDIKRFSLEDQLKGLLDINDKNDILSLIDEHYRNEEGKFFLILDGFSEALLQREKKIQFFESIVNFICAIENRPSIKIILSMRSTLWMRFFEHIRHSVYLRSKWFKGNFFNLNEISNVPPLSEKEVDLIIAKINREDSNKINSNLKTQLKVPLHIQLYYQLKEEDPHFNYATNISFFELISKFIEERIYRSNYYTEKILFLKKVIQLTDYARQGTAVAKNSLINELSAFKNAYTELLADGILLEERQYYNAHPREYVRFTQHHIFEYFLFIELLEKFQLQVDESFFRYIEKEYSGNQIYFLLLQWTCRFLIRVSDFKSLKLIIELKLSNYEKNFLLLFIAENLKYRADYSPETKMILNDHFIHECIIEQIINFDFIDSCYIDAIEAFLEIANPKTAFLYHTILVVADIFSLDEERIESRLNALKGIRDADHSWIVSPVEVTEAVLQKIKPGLINNEPLFTKMSNFIANPSNYVAADSKVDTKEAITYVMMWLITFFYGSTFTVVDLIQAILKARPSILHKKSHLSTYILFSLASAFVRANVTKKANQLEKILHHLSKDKCRYSMTQYMQALHLKFQAEQHNVRGEFQLALNCAFESLKLFKSKNLNALSLMLYNLIIDIHYNLKDFNNVNEFKLEKAHFIEEKNINRHLF